MSRTSKEGLELVHSALVDAVEVKLVEVRRPRGSRYPFVDGKVHLTGEDLQRRSLGRGRVMIASLSITSTMARVTRTD